METQSLFLYQVTALFSYFFPKSPVNNASEKWGMSKKIGAVSGVYWSVIWRGNSSTNLSRWFRSDERARSALIWPCTCGKLLLVHAQFTDGTFIHQVFGRTRHAMEAFHNDSVLRPGGISDSHFGVSWAFSGVSRLEVSVSEGCGGVSNLKKGIPGLLSLSHFWRQCL